MLNTLMSSLIDKIKTITELKQVEPYEGQFDGIDEYVIKPPSCFVEITQGQNGQILKNTDCQISLYLVTGHIKGRVPESMLDLIDSIKVLLHRKQLADVGKTFFQSFQRLAIFPGFCTYQINLEFKEE